MLRNLLKKYDTTDMVMYLIGVRTGSPGHLRFVSNLVIWQVQRGSLVRFYYFWVGTGEYLFTHCFGLYIGLWDLIHD